MHRGELTASSEGKNKGATFAMHLPTDAPATAIAALDMQPPHQHQPAPDPAMSGPHTSALPVAPASDALPPPPRTGPLKVLKVPLTVRPLFFGAYRIGDAAYQVLLVEDNKSTLMIMSRLLRQKLGFAVVVASSVADALRVAAEEKASDEGQVDVVVSDIGLPDGSGLELMAALKATYHLPVHHLPPHDTTHSAGVLQMARHSHIFLSLVESRGSRCRDTGRRRTWSGAGRPGSTSTSPSPSSSPPSPPPSINSSRRPTSAADVITGSNSVRSRPPGNQAWTSEPGSYFLPVCGSTHATPRAMTDPRGPEQRTPARR